MQKKIKLKLAINKAPKIISILIFSEFSLGFQIHEIKTFKFFVLIKTIIAKKKQKENLILGTLKKISQVIIN